jgi:hypothetical protein
VKLLVSLLLDVFLNSATEMIFAGTIIFVPEGKYKKEK